MKKRFYREIALLSMLGVNIVAMGLQDEYSNYRFYDYPIWSLFSFIVTAILLFTAGMLGLGTATSDGNRTFTQTPIYIYLIVFLSWTYYLNPVMHTEQSWLRWLLITASLFACIIAVLRLRIFVKNEWPWSP